MDRHARGAGRATVRARIALSSVAWSIPFLSVLSAPAFAKGETAARPRGSLEEIVSIERSFSDDSAKLGTKKSFLKYAADDGVIFRPGPVPAVATLNEDPDDDQGATLQWWPVMGAIARSDDLALSVGPWVIHSPGSPAQELYGYYATVWRKQPDGSWKFVIDGAGARLANAPTKGRGSDVHALASPAVEAMDSAQALEAVRHAEEKLSALAQQDAHAAIAAALAREAWLMGSPVEPGIGKDAASAELARRPQKLSFLYRGGGASSAGDLVYTYGSAVSSDPKIPLLDASYLHVWQRRPEGWRLVFEGIKSRR